MSNAESDAYELRALEEVTLGTTPASAMTITRNTGEGLNFDIASVVSKEIRSDGQVTDLTQSGSNANGNVDFSLSYGTYDLFLQAAMRSTFSADLAIAEITIDADDSDNSFNDSGSGLGSIVAGQWVLVAGYDTAANNGYFLVTSATSSKVIVNATLVTEAAGDSVTIKGQMLRNGTTKKSFTLEKDFTDISQMISYTGMRVNTINLNVATGENVSGSMGFMGLDSARGTVTVGTGSAIAATTTPLINAVNNVGDIREGSAVMTGVFLQKVSIDINNNLRPQPAIGSTANIGMAYGKFDLKGALTAYFANGDLYDKYINNTETSFSFRLTDSAGNVYIVTAHAIKFSSSQIVAGSENSDVIAELAYQAFRHTTYDCTLQIDKFDA